MLEHTKKWNGSRSRHQAFKTPKVSREESVVGVPFLNRLGSLLGALCVPTVGYG